MPEAAWPDGDASVVLDRAVLLRLVEELDCAWAVLRVAGIYRDNLAGRVERLEDAVRRGDDVEALAVAHTLRVASAMVGATRMQRCAQQLVDALSAGDRRAVGRGVLQLRSACRWTAWALTAFVGAA